MICLNSIMELIGRIKTMFRILRASTPVEELLRGRQDGRDSLFVVLKVAQVLIAEAAVFGGDSLAIVRIFAGFHLVDEVAHRERVVLGRAEHQRLFPLVDHLHEDLHPVGFALLDLDDLLKSASSYRLPASSSPSTSVSSGVYTYSSRVVDICLTLNGVRKPSLIPSLRE